MDATRDMLALELALLRRGLHDLAEQCERCRHCRRSPLIGEHVYSLEAGGILCELCRTLEREAPGSSRKVRGPEFGHTMRIFDNRPSAA